MSSKCFPTFFGRVSHSTFYSNTTKKRLLIKRTDTGYGDLYVQDLGASLGAKKHHRKKGKTTAAVGQSFHTNGS